MGLPAAGNEYRIRIIKSTAKRAVLTEEEILLHKLQNLMLNKVRLKTEPYGTPFLSCCVDEMVMPRQSA